jgi:surfactin synthase thioesterase subunit
VAAHEAPDIHWDCKAYELLTDEDFMKRMITFGGFPNFDWKMMTNKFFLKLYFQPIREDYRLLASYRMKQMVKLPAPATMVYSPQDIETEKIHSWDKFTDGTMEYIELGRNHFFMKEHAEEFAEVIAERVRK